MKKARILCAVAFLGLALLASPSVLASELSEQSLRGFRLYQRYCATCHGARGDGRGESAWRLSGPPPQDFTRGVYKLRSTPKGSLPMDSDLMRTIRRGVPGTAMPAWAGILEDTDISALVATIKGFSSRFVGGEAPQAVEIPKTLPAATAAGIERGRNLYLLMKCFTCHGMSGAGDGPEVPKLKDDIDRPIAPRNFTRGVFKGGESPREVYRTLATGLDGTPMVSFFGDNQLLVRPLVHLRESFAKEILSSPQLTDKDRRDLEEFIANLPSASAFDNLEEEQQEALVQGWKEDLVHYVRHLADRDMWWRRLLGLTPQRQLYGEGSDE